MKKFFLLALLVPHLWSQNTVITATISDASGQHYSFGTWKVDFFPAPNTPGPYTQQGAAFTQHFSGSMDSTGTFTVTVASTSSISPAKSQWSFTVCPDATFPCTTTNQTVNGATLDMSANISAYLPAMVDINPNPNFNAAYANPSVGPPTKIRDGSSYFNTTDGTIRFWYHGSWVSVGGGISTIPISGLTSAIAGNSINNGDFSQIWYWNLTGPSAMAGLALSEQVASTNTGNGSALLRADTITGSTISPFIATAHNGSAGLSVGPLGNINAMGTAHFNVNNNVAPNQCLATDTNGNIVSAGVLCQPGVGNMVTSGAIATGYYPVSVGSNAFVQGNLFQSQFFTNGPFTFQAVPPLGNAHPTYLQATSDGTMGTIIAVTSTTVDTAGTLVSFAINGNGTVSGTTTAGYNDPSYIVVSSFQNNDLIGLAGMFTCTADAAGIHAGHLVGTSDGTAGRCKDLGSTCAGLTPSFVIGVATASTSGSVFSVPIIVGGGSMCR